MPKPSITEATDITAEVVLGLGKYHSAQELRNLQAKLTSTSRELRGLTKGNSLLARIGEKLSFEQLQLLQDAAKLIESVNANIEHAKEKRKRIESDTKLRQQARGVLAKRLVAETFVFTGEPLDQLLDVLRTVLMFNPAHIFQDCYSPQAFNLKLQGYLAPSYTEKLIGCPSPQIFWKNTLLSLRSDLMHTIEHEIGYDDGSSVYDRLQALKQKVTDCVSKVLLSTDEEETLRLWSQALSPATTQEGSL